jgi:hypothetical protein
MFMEPEFPENPEPWELLIRATFLSQFVLEEGAWVWPTLPAERRSTLL